MPERSHAQHGNPDEGAAVGPRFPRMSLQDVCADGKSRLGRKAAQGANMVARTASQKEACTSFLTVKPPECPSASPGYKFFYDKEERATVE